MNQQNSPQYVYSAPVLPTSGLAIASLVTGILGFTFLPLIASVVALLTGYAARKETRATPPVASGDGMATAGIVLGWIQVGLAVIGLFCFVAYMIFVLGLLGSSLRVTH